MKNNVIMWTETNPAQKLNLKAALYHATQPIRDAAKLFEWEGHHLTCGPDVLKNHQEEWRNLYFYLSGYGDAQFQLGADVTRKAPVPIPVAASSPPNSASEIGSQIHAAAASSAPSQPLARTMQKLRDLSQAMLGVLDCAHPDGDRRGEALAAWIELRETLDVLWLDPPLAGQ